MYGRTWILHICNFFSLGFNIGCAFAPDTSTLIVFRFLGMFLKKGLQLFFNLDFSGIYWQRTCWYRRRLSWGSLL